MDRFKKNRPSAIEGIIENKFGRMMRNMSFPGKNSSYFSAWEPSVDIYQLEDQLILYMDVSGVPADEIKVVAESQKLVISGKRRCTVTGITAVHQLENEYGPFRRVIDLPLFVDVDASTSENLDGFLVIYLPILKENGIHE